MTERRYYPTVSIPQKFKEGFCRRATFESVYLCFLRPITEKMNLFAVWYPNKNKHIYSTERKTSNLNKFNAAVSTIDPTTLVAHAFFSFLAPGKKGNKTRKPNSKRKEAKLLFFTLICSEIIFLMEPYILHVTSKTNYTTLRYLDRQCFFFFRFTFIIYYYPRG